MAVLIYCCGNQTLEASANRYDNYGYIFNGGAMMLLSQKVNGIEITAHNIRRGNNQLKADICMPILDSDDRMLNQITLRYSDQEIKDSEGSLIDPYIPAVNGQPGRRCDTVSFSVSDRKGFPELETFFSR